MLDCSVQMYYGNELGFVIFSLRFVCIETGCWNVNEQRRILSVS